MQVGEPRLVDNTVTQALQPGSPAGRYVVEWRVTSADGHPISGTFSFTAAAPGTGEPVPVPEPAMPAAPAAPAGGTDLVAELQKLAALKDAGILSDQEFAAAKAKLIG